ncbi:hypothetical protein TSAR_015644 [Trichomalopsis sarcophagae]|uniref:Uncharacterized protein n=1 Tax=Trichomalopsis sarcophagae TaxID=543379 RepID=A0A232EFC0_9HYME|nr:hypothetical protein TSAR_015644 [Trichomalopsis sarcophagae]
MLVRVVSPKETSQIDMSTRADLKTWHDCLGYVGARALQDMIQIDRVTSVKLKNVDKFFCLPFHLGKVPESVLEKVVHLIMRNSEVLKTLVIDCLKNTFKLMMRFINMQIERVLRKRCLIINPSTLKKILKKFGVLDAKSVCAYLLIQTFYCIHTKGQPPSQKYELCMEYPFLKKRYKKSEAD